MSKRVTRKSSIINRPTCGGPIKAGLAPRSTNFMFSMKPNHIFKGKPFVDNKTSFDYECLKNENEQNFSNIIKQLNNEIQKTNNTLSLTLTEEIKKTEVTNMKDIRYLINDALNGYVITQVSQQQNGVLVTTTKSEPTEDTEDRFADRLFQFIMILINGFFISKKQIFMNVECLKQLGSLKTICKENKKKNDNIGMFDYYANLSKEPLDCFLGKKNLEKTENKFNSINDLKVGDIVFQWKKKSSENNTDYLLEVFAGILMYMQCSVYYHVGIVVEVPDPNWSGWAAGENPFTSDYENKIKVVWNATIGKDSMTNIGKDYGGAIFSTLEDFSAHDYTSVRHIIYNKPNFKPNFKTHFNTRCGLIWDYMQSLNNGKGPNYDLAFLSSWLDAETRKPNSLTCNLSLNNSNSNNSDDIMSRMKNENTCDCRKDKDPSSLQLQCDKICMCTDPGVCRVKGCEDRFVTRRNQGCNFFCSGFVAFILKYASSSEFPLVKHSSNNLCPHIIRPPDLSGYAAYKKYNHYNDDILKQGYDYFKDSYEDEEYIYTNNEN